MLFFLLVVNINASVFAQNSYFLKKYDNVDENIIRSYITYYENFLKIEQQYIELQKSNYSITEKDSISNSILFESKKIINSLDSLFNRDTTNCNSSGIVFKNVVGAARKLRNSDNILIDVYQNPKLEKYLNKKYFIISPCYRNFSEALEAKNRYRELGLKDTWLMAFKNGELIDLKKALSELSEE